MEQYKQPPEGTGTVSVPNPALIKTPADIKIQKLEEQLFSQHQEVAKLRRDVMRLKNAVSDLELMIKNRG